jgi:hypothetical protein
MALTLNGSTGIVVADGATIGSTSDTDAITVPANGKITFNQAVLAQAGIQPNSNSYAAAETITDYETGTFSPTLANEGDSNLSTTKNATYNTARYVKIGPIVFIQFTVSISALSGDSGSQHLIIDNLPYVSKSYQSNSNGAFNATYQSSMDTAVTYGMVLGSSDNLRLYSAPATPLYSNALQATSWFQGYGQYETDS